MAGLQSLAGLDPRAHPDPYPLITYRDEIMIARIFATALLLTASATTFALDIKPFTAQTLKAEQQAGKPVTLHFHANWCPTCRAQEKIFQQWERRCQCSRHPANRRLRQ